MMSIPDAHNPEIRDTQGAMATARIGHVAFGRFQAHSKQWAWHPEPKIFWLYIYH
jgi:hypothetical protein